MPFPFLPEVGSLKIENSELQNYAIQIQSALTAEFMKLDLWLVKQYTNPQSQFFTKDKHNELITAEVHRLTIKKNGTSQGSAREINFVGMDASVSGDTASVNGKKMSIVFGG